MKKSLYLPLVALAAMTVFSSCKKDTKEPEETPVETPSTPALQYPTTYNFANANFTTSTQRIAMLGELAGHIRAAHTITAATQPTVSAQKLKDMFMNVASQFTTTGANTSGIQLKDQCSAQFNIATELEAAFDDAEPASITAAANPTVTTASNGTKGKLVSPNRAILVNATGLEYKEQVEKGLMGALLYYKATTILNTISSFDNSTIVNGQTAQEKAWDEAFGYFGVPIDFPTNTTGLKNWGSYCNNVNNAIQSNTTIMTAFLKGRAAVSAKNDTERDAARTIVVNTWEKVGAARCITYMKQAKTNIADDANRNHLLSEGIGFIKGFRYNTQKKISDSQIATLIGYFGSNLYSMTAADMDNVINTIASIYSLDASVL
ncbi:MAG: hypothetical protein K0S32_2011 [Bacteroidetes bacterium]|nr:hypothetical protein [Bacteroidota bacterium]